MAKFSSVKIFSGFLVSSIDALDTVRKSIQPVKIQQCSAGVVICLERGADCLQSEAQLTPLHPKTHHLLPQLNLDWFYLPGPGSARLSWKEAVKWL